MTHPIRIALLTSAVLVGSVGCESTVTGNEGNFQFSYPADDAVLDFNKPIAVGARLDLKVRTVGDRRAVTLTDASTGDDAVLSVDGFEDDTVTLLATGDGNTTVTVVGAPDGGLEASDTVNMLARVPEVHDLAHTCTSDPSAAYLVDQKVYVPFELEMANGQPVIGYGYYPVAPSDSAVLALDDSHQGYQYMRFDTLAAGDIVLESTLTDTVLAMSVVEAGSIDGVQDPIAFVIEDIDVGDTNPFYVRPMVGAQVLCQGETAFSVSSDSPDICDVRVIDNPSNTATATGNEFGWFEVEGLAEGTCAYTVTFGEGAGGAGVSKSFEHPIEP